MCARCRHRVTWCCTASTIRVGGALRGRVFAFLSKDVQEAAILPASINEKWARAEVSALTSLVVFAVLRVSLHAVVQLHQDRLQSRVHLLDQLVVHNQRPEQDAQHYTHGKKKSRCELSDTKKTARQKSRVALISKTWLVHFVFLPRHKSRPLVFYWLAKRHPENVLRRNYKVFSNTRIRQLNL